MTKLETILKTKKLLISKLGSIIDNWYLIIYQGFNY